MKLTTGGCWVLGLFIVACGGADPDGAEDMDGGSTGTSAAPPPSLTSADSGSEGTTSGSAEGTSTGVGDSTGGSTGDVDYDGPYNAPPDCQAGEVIIEFPGGLSICSASCTDAACPDPEIAGVVPMCGVTVNGGSEPSQCILGCDPAADTCPGETTCEFFGGGSFCAGGSTGVGDSGGGDTGEPPGGCAQACEILKGCDFSGPVSLMTEAECLAACEANVAASPAYCGPRLDNFLMCVVDEPCLFAEDSCLISSSNFQVCLL